MKNYMVCSMNVKYLIQNWLFNLDKMLNMMKVKNNNNYHGNR